MRASNSPASGAHILVPLQSLNTADKVELVSPTVAPLADVVFVGMP